MIVKGVYLIPLLLILPSLAFALPTPDTGIFLGQRTYAVTTVNEGDCSHDGGNSDHDGICNNWKNQTKHNGLHITFNFTLPRTSQSVNYTYVLQCNPFAVYANPGTNQHIDPTGITVCPRIGNKDVYVELDWMHGQLINSKAVQDVVAAYYKHGINLHVQLGENGSTTGGDIGFHYCNVDPQGASNLGSAGQACTNPPNLSNVASYPILKQNFFGTKLERNPGASGSIACPRNDYPTSQPQPQNLYSANCLTAKRQVFHYVTAVIFQASNTASSGWSERYGNDFVISLGNFVNGTGNIDEQEASLMHELGHNLALDHGGVNGDTNNCKPNYLSVMNYVYEFRESADSCRPLDYSTSSLSSLNQNSLTDSNIGSYPYPSDNKLKGPDGQVPSGGGNCPTSGERPIWWSLGSSIISGFTGTVNDWNHATTTTYSQVLNNIGPTCSAVTTTPYPTLNGNDDWNCIKNGCGTVTIPMNFRSSSSFVLSNPQYNGTDLNDTDLSNPDGHSDTTFVMPP